VLAWFSAPPLSWLPCGRQDTSNWVDVLVGGAVGYGIGRAVAK
jgi:hypothetical protein